MLSLVTVLEGREAEEGAEKRKGKEEKGMGQEEVGGGGGGEKGDGGGEENGEKGRGGRSIKRAWHVRLQGRCVSKIM